MPTIFINYRSSDALATATLLDRELSESFGAEEIFRAGRSIRGGKRFPEQIRRALRKCDVLVALIGPGWRDARAEDGTRALDCEDDWVRREIADAFAHGLAVLPVLLDRTARLKPADVPEELVELVELQNLTLDHRHPQEGIDRIIDAIVDEAPELGAGRNAQRRGVERSAVDSAFRGNLFLGRTRVDGDVVGGDKHIRGSG